MANSGKWRETIEIPNMSHGNNPIPAATRIGNMVFTGGVLPSDPETGKVPENDPAKQAEFVFRNAERIMQAAGGSMADVGRITVFVKDLSIREHVNTEWLKYFPDEHDRPSRHTQQIDLRGATLIQLEVVGVLKS